MEYLWQVKYSTWSTHEFWKRHTNNVASIVTCKIQKNVSLGHRCPRFQLKKNEAQHQKGVVKSKNQTCPPLFLWFLTLCFKWFERRPNVGQTDILTRVKLNAPDLMSSGRDIKSCCCILYSNQLCKLTTYLFWIIILQVWLSIIQEEMTKFYFTYFFNNRKYHRWSVYYDVLYMIKYCTCIPNVKLSWATLMLPCTRHKGIVYQFNNNNFGWLLSNIK
jgi:hypothetical protein